MRTCKKIDSSSHNSSSHNSSSHNSSSHNSSSSDDSIGKINGITSDDKDSHNQYCESLLAVRKAMHNHVASKSPMPNIVVPVSPIPSQMVVVRSGSSPVQRGMLQANVQKESISWLFTKSLLYVTAGLCLFIVPHSFMNCPGKDCIWS